MKPKKLQTIIDTKLINTIQIFNEKHLNLLHLYLVLRSFLEKFHVKQGMTFGTWALGFYHAMLCRARNCYGKSSVYPCLSISDVEISWSHRLEIFKNNRLLSYL